MPTLGSDEKNTVVMSYTHDSMVRGEAITKQGIRVSTWFRTDGAPDYLHLTNIQWVAVTGGPVKPLAFPEMYLSLELILGFHIMPPAAEPLDYDERETNRVNAPLSFLMGRFLVKGKMRISPQTDVGTTLSISHTKWLSIYEAEISCPYLPQMPPMQVPMMVVRPMQLAFVPG